MKAIKTHASAFGITSVDSWELSAKEVSAIIAGRVNISNAVEVIRYLVLTNDVGDDETRGVIEAELKSITDSLDSIKGAMVAEM